ncbi:MAG TPA: DMT family transporter [Polymorphobacter sp.]|jgi:O-acetylserine/cysteine efflux transporter|nr:DMT family transporter [Polymorphobacter sp.]
MKPIHIAFILLIDLIWAGNVVAIKYSVDAVAPLMAVTLRYGIVLGACLPFMRWVPGQMRLIAVTGVIAGALAMGLGSLSFAAAYNVSALAIAGQLGVPFSLILAIIFYRERIRWVRIIGILLSFLGVAVMVFDPRIFDERIAILLTVAGTFCWAVGTLLFRQLRDLHPLNVHGWLALISIPLLGLASWYQEPGALAHIGAVAPSTWGWLAYSALGGSVIGHAGMSYLFRHYPVTMVSPMTLPTPLLSVIVATVVLGTPVTIEMVIGGILTMIGIAIITLRTANAPEVEVLA